ncbi:hypothetical protein PanWU01x14_008290 [Parasponia andersonii]|uniref:Transmembrane protein n=1 Tax=Parasponia andersonii TaxID=3476 RepID=A0A2P5E261_PARAD|nr:hypothetical protein PanWU01x14_008290 [Parasponia andersonii]
MATSPPKLDLTNHQSTCFLFLLIPLIGTVVYNTVTHSDLSSPPRPPASSIHFLDHNSTNRAFPPGPFAGSRLWALHLSLFALRRWINHLLRHPRILWPNPQARIRYQIYFHRFSGSWAGTFSSKQSSFPLILSSSSSSVGWSLKLG